MKREWMKIGLLTVLVAACGAMYWAQFVRTPKYEPQVRSAEDEAEYTRQELYRKKMAEMPGYTIAGS